MFKNFTLTNHQQSENMRLRKMQTLGRFSQGKGVQIWPCDQDTRCSLLKQPTNQTKTMKPQSEGFAHQWLQIQHKPPEVMGSVTMSRRVQRHFRCARMTESLSILVRRLTCANENPACSYQLKTIMDTVLLCLVTWSSKEKCKALGNWEFSK